MRRFLAGLILSVLSLASFAAEQFIVKDGKPNAQIVISPENRPRMTTLAALELQKWIEEMSGARLPIVTKPDSRQAVKIYVGKSSYTDKMGIKDEGLKNGAFKVVSGEDYLVLLGNDWNFVPPFEPWPKDRKDAAPQEKWKNITASKTDGEWLFPFGGQGKRIWQPKDFSKILDSYYGNGSSELWVTGGNQFKGFYMADEAGSINAVSDFLHSLGVRFYMPVDDLGTIIPKIKSISLPKVDKKVNPHYAVRNWMWYNYGNFPLEEVLWALRLGINSGYQKMGPSTGPHGLVIVHGSKKMMEKHPEYYAMFGGKRAFESGKGHGTPCFTSEAFIQETVRYCRFMFDELNLPCVDIWPGDGLQMCQCENCKGKTPSELVWGFTDKVASEVYKTHPDKLITGGAYTSYDTAPDTIEKFSPNVAVAIYNYSRPSFLDPDIWNYYHVNIEKWRSKLAPGNIRRGENNLYNGSPSAARRQLVAYPIIFPRGMAKDLKYLKGVSYGELAESPQLPGKWKAPGLDHLALYIQASFLMNADQDIDKVLDEYYSLFYGPAAKEMREALTYAEDNIATKDKSKSGGRTNITNVSVDKKLHLRELLQKAKAAAGDGIYGKRVAKFISELKTKEQVIAEEEEQKKILAERKAKARQLDGVEGSDLSKAQEYSLVSTKTGEVVEFPTSFKLGWDKN
ncbi:MAG TPA: DUF4838 domain-containing protein, partial [Victivallales bacterium]|nr:DUF4838 domain-containing protein [Victivallales bacterium]